MFSFQCSSVVTLRNQLSNFYQIIVVVIKIHSALVMLVLFFSYSGVLDETFSTFLLCYELLVMSIGLFKNHLVSR